MDAFAAAGVVALARGLLTLSRTPRSGVLCIEAGNRCCRIAIVDGAARAVATSHPSPLLGDWLLGRGELDSRVHAAALETDTPLQPVGEWLAARGIASAEAVRLALGDQLRARVMAALRWHRATLQFTAGFADIGVPWLAGAVDLSELSLSAVAAAYDAARFATWVGAHGDARVELSALGQHMIDAGRVGTLGPELHAAIERGSSLACLVERHRGSAASLPQLAALCWLGVVVPKAPRRGQYAFLLHKRAQLRRGAGAAELLEVPHDAKAEEVRRALRRMAKHAHPDALGPTAPESIRIASGELMQALVQAEADLQPRAARARAR